jgi:hypothetical protein
MSSASVSLSHLATEFVIIPVNVTKSGVLANPTADTVQFAFLLNPTASPQLSDWVNGSWDTSSNSIYSYLAQCLVGPVGAITLGTGTYAMWLKITDNPEVPVQQVGQLIIY